ncbi:MAG: flagellar biosynthesis protein FlgM [Treponema sp. CETP13]|nr:MAG: flagellar biosynthesis protein FlgM [Treponema sp. CETP13]
MVIEKLGGIDPLKNIQNAKKISDTKELSSAPDSIAISKEAKEMSELYFMNEVAAGTPDVRADRIADVKAKIQDPDYLNSKTIASTASKIMESFGI